METEVIPPTRLKPAPLTVAWEIATAAVPVFVRVNVCELLEPVATFPKLKLVELAASVPEGGLPGFPGVPALVNPTHPESVKAVSSVARMANKASGLCRLGSSVVTDRFGLSLSGLRSCGREFMMRIV
jgi:hypothetical protein